MSDPAIVWNSDDGYTSIVPLVWRKPRDSVKIQPAQQDTRQTLY